jgi:hypothetical protein
VPVKPEVKAIASGLTDRFLPNAPMLAVDTVAIAPDLPKFFLILMLLMSVVAVDAITPLGNVSCGISQG